MCPFVPQLPTKRDRSDAGLRADGNYHVFLKAGPDALVSTRNKPLLVQQEFIFGTSAFSRGDVQTSHSPRVRPGPA